MDALGLLQQLGAVPGARVGDGCTQLVHAGFAGTEHLGHGGRLDHLSPRLGQDSGDGVYLAGSSERAPGDDNGVRTRPTSAVVPASSPT